MKLSGYCSIKSYSNCRCIVLHKLVITLESVFGYSQLKISIRDLVRITLYSMWKSSDVVVSALDFWSDGWNIRGLVVQGYGWSLHCCVVSLDKKLGSTFSIFTQVYKWLLATYC